MSEIPAPYGHPSKKSAPERIAAYLNAYLGPESLMDISYPEHLQIPADEMTEAGQDEYVLFTFHHIFGESACALADFLGRGLTAPELGLVRRRVVLFLKKNGFFLEGA